MHIDLIPNRGSRPTVLLRESVREGKRVFQRTIANLTKLPPHAVLALQQALKGQTLVPVEKAFTIERSLPHGQVRAILGMIRKLGLDALIAAKRCRERDLVVAMIAERLLHGCSKLACTRYWHTTTLAEELGLEDADEDDLYTAMDWLLERQGRIERKLAARHLREGGLVWYDVSSSYYTGRHCNLARYGHNRDETRDPIIVYGVLTDDQGRPIATDVYPGNTGDPTTVPDQVEKLRSRFGLQRVVLVGDRGMLTDTQISTLRKYPQLGWISALRSGAIKQLLEVGDLTPSLFDRENLAEIHAAEFPGERLVACFNAILAEDRARTREELLAATEKKLRQLAATVARRTKTPLSAAAIGERVGRVINHYKVAKHFTRHIEDGQFQWERNQESIDAEAALDGIYVIRTSEPAANLTAADTVRSYKSLAQVEHGFRCLKGLDIRIRPIRHRDDDRVRAHVFLCLLAYYVEWHMREALHGVLFDDEELSANRPTRDPVDQAQPSASARRKKFERTTAEGWPVHSWKTLLADLATLCRNRCRIPADKTGATFTQDTQPTDFQAHVFKCLGV